MPAISNSFRSSRFSSPQISEKRSAKVQTCRDRQLNHYLPHILAAQDRASICLRSFEESCVLLFSDISSSPEKRSMLATISSNTLGEWSPGAVAGIPRGDPLFKRGIVLLAAHEFYKSKLSLRFRTSQLQPHIQFQPPTTTLLKDPYPPFQNCASSSDALSSAFIQSQVSFLLSAALLLKRFEIWC